jgi:hypothetical protein
MRFVDDDGLLAIARSFAGSGQSRPSSRATRSNSAGSALSARDFWCSNLAMRSRNPSAGQVSRRGRKDAEIGSSHSIRIGISGVRRDLRPSPSSPASSQSQRGGPGARTGERPGLWRWNGESVCGEGVGSGILAKFMRRELCICRCGSRGLRDPHCRRRPRARKPLWISHFRAQAPLDFTFRARRPTGQRSNPHFARPLSGVDAQQAGKVKLDAACARESEIRGGLLATPTTTRRSGRATTKVRR